MRGLGSGIVSTQLFPPFGAGNCPAPSQYVKGRGCCIKASQRPPGAPKKDQCCGVGKARVVHHPGGVSLACKPAPGGGGTGGGGGAAGSGSFKVLSVSGNTLTADRNLSANCKPGQQPELRRPNTTGGAEFGGDVDGISGNQVQFSGTVSNPPAPGDTFFIYCANAGGAGGDAGSGFFDAGFLPSGSSLMPWLVGAGLLGGAYWLFTKHKSSGSMGPVRRYR